MAGKQVVLAAFLEVSHFRASKLTFGVRYAAM